MDDDGGVDIVARSHIALWLFSLITTSLQFWNDTYRFKVKIENNPGLNQKYSWDKQILFNKTITTILAQKIKHNIYHTLN